ncbi:MAG: YeiH family protein [Erysipelotrichaceae bacterium]
MGIMKKNLPGILLCLLIAIPAWLLGKQFPIIGGPVFGILFGMLITIWKKPIFFQSGIKFTSKILLQLSIILLGFEMNLYHVIEVGQQSLMVMLFTLTTSFTIAYFVGKMMKIDRNTTILIGVGTSICGGSAIAATAPVIQSKEEEVAQAISTIFLFNIVAVFLFPMLGHLLGLSDTGFGMWAGTAINDTSSVVAAGASWSASAGNNIALNLATIVKLTRTLMIVPITFSLAIYTSHKAKKEAGNNFNIIKIFPWFVIGFILAAIINTFVELPIGLGSNLVMIGKFMIVMAMCAIGLNTDFKHLITDGLKPIGLGLCCWFGVAVVSLLVQSLMGLL